MKRHAFTLIELLVVIAIIIALLAILMPAMGRAMELAARATCGSNQSQLYTATLLYASDNLGAYPQTNRAGRTATDHVSWVNPDVYETYSDDYGMELLEFTCPNRGDEFVIYRHGWYRLGFYVLFGRNNDIWGHGSSVPWESPKSAAQPGRDGIMVADLIEVNTATPPVSSASHTAGGLAMAATGTHPITLGSEGGNRNTVDGAVQWIDQSKLAEHTATSSAGIYGWW